MKNELDNILAENTIIPEAEHGTDVTEWYNTEKDGEVTLVKVFAAKKAEAARLAEEFVAYIKASDSTLFIQNSLDWATYDSGRMNYCVTLSVGDEGAIIEPTPIEPDAKEGTITCGTSEAGDAVGYHKADTDEYGKGDVTIDGMKVVQLRALNGSLRLRFDQDAAPQGVVSVNIGGVIVDFIREDGQHRYNAVDAEASALFVDGDTLDVSKGEVDNGGGTIEPPENGDDDGTIEPPKETKPAKKKQK